MTTTLTKIGDRYALFLDPDQIAALGIDGQTPLAIEVDEAGIHIRPEHDPHRARVLASAGKMMQIHDETFRKLAQ